MKPHPTKNSGILALLPCLVFLIQCSDNQSFVPIEEEMNRASNHSGQNESWGFPVLTQGPSLPSWFDQRCQQAPSLGRKIFVNYANVPPWGQGRLHFEGANEIGLSRSERIRGNNRYRLAPGFLITTLNGYNRSFPTHGNASPNFLKIVSDVSRLGRKSMKISVPTTERTWATSARSELVAAQVGTQATRWYAFSFFLKKGKHIYSPFVLAQIWQNVAPCGAHTTPPIAFQLFPDNSLRVGISRSHIENYTTDFRQHPTYSSERHSLIKKIAKGNWIDVYFKVKFSHNHSGQLIVRTHTQNTNKGISLNLDLRNINIGHNCNCGSFFKVGHYDSTPETLLNFHTLYLDEVKWARRFQDIKIQAGISSP